MKAFYAWMTVAVIVFITFIGTIMVSSYDSLKTSKAECEEKNGQYVKTGPDGYYTCFSKGTVIELTNDN